MKLHHFLLIAAVAAVPARADEAKKLSPENFDAADRAGYFTDSFKQALRDFVASKQLLADTKAEQAKMDQDLPALQKQAAKTQASLVAMRQELAKYEHPEEIDFDMLQARMKDPAAKSDEQLALAQAYVWTFPASPHAVEVQGYLQGVQKKIADQQQAVRDAEAARLAAHEELVRRAQAHDLDLAGWRTLLRDMSQEDLVRLIGHPSQINLDDWTYAGPLMTDAMGRKVGLEITLDAGRVINVDAKPSGP